MSGGLEAGRLENLGWETRRISGGRLENLGPPILNLGEHMPVAAHMATVWGSSGRLENLGWETRESRATDFGPG